MDHLVAVRTDGAHVAVWRYLIVFSDLGNGNKVVNMNKPSSDLAVTRLKIKPAYSAAAAKDSDALQPCCAITLIRVHARGAAAAFLKLSRAHFRRVLDRSAGGLNSRRFKK